MQWRNRSQNDNQEVGSSVDRRICFVYSLYEKGYYRRVQSIFISICNYRRILNWLWPYLQKGTPFSPVLRLVRNFGGGSEPAARQGRAFKRPWVRLDTLKRHFPAGDPVGLSVLTTVAALFEEKIFTSAENQADYLRKISLKMLTMETKSAMWNSTASNPTREKRKFARSR
ncbi:hypothetical protein AMTR_s00166p00015600 [Amborella trichopoda]|uniref:Mediator complex subunit 15 KIX domain-containing protein n=1 Tax=Amborella trichopoda TaxID=13333 RepID=W1PT91_AMBTC|nr:hypothetical protein AMTR_s00166p00015600 [Amborella trichopoda]